MTTAVASPAAEAAALYRRHSPAEPFAGRVERDERGRPFYRYQDRCRRCGGAGGSEKWRHTGLTCYDCAGSGNGRIVAEPLYTLEQLERLNAAAAKRQAKREAAARAAEEARREPFLAWQASRIHVLEQIRQLAPEDLAERIFADCAAYRIPAEWLLDVAVAAILRNGVRADARSASQHVGQVGERLELELTCEKLLDFSERGHGGYLVRSFYIALMRDGAGNRIVYKGGRPPLGEGEAGKFRATVKDHDERDGEKQTVIERAKALNS
jgi:hypothetical protein